MTVEVYFYYKVVEMLFLLKLIYNVAVWNSSGVVVNVLNCNIVINEFELQLHYYDHFQTNTLGKSLY